MSARSSASPTRLSLCRQRRQLRTYLATRKTKCSLLPRSNKIIVSPSVKGSAKISSKKLIYLLQYNRLILWIFCDTEGFYIEHGNTNAEEESIDRLWLVVRSLKNPEGKFDYKIKKFDAIKLGRVRFRVKDFRCEQMNLTERELYNQEIKEAQAVKTSADVV